MKGSAGSIPVSAPPILQPEQEGFTSTNGDVDGGSESNDDFDVYGDDGVMANLRDLVRETIEEMLQEKQKKLNEASDPSLMKVSGGSDMYTAIKNAQYNSREGAMDEEEYIKRAILQQWKRDGDPLDAMTEIEVLTQFHRGLTRQMNLKVEQETKLLEPLIKRAVKKIQTEYGFEDAEKKYRREWLAKNSLQQNASRAKGRAQASRKR